LLFSAFSYREDNYLVFCTGFLVLLIMSYGLDVLEYVPLMFIAEHKYTIK